MSGTPLPLGLGGGLSSGGGGSANADSDRSSGGTGSAAHVSYAALSLHGAVLEAVACLRAQNGATPRLIGQLLVWLALLIGFNERIASIGYLPHKYALPTQPHHPKSREAAWRLLQAVNYVDDDSGMSTAVCAR